MGKGDRMKPKAAGDGSGGVDSVRVWLGVSGRHHGQVWVVKRCCGEKHSPPKKDNSKLVGPYRGGELFRTTGAEWLAIQLSITGLWTRCPWSEPILDPRRASRSDGGKEKTPLKEENS